MSKKTVAMIISAILVISSAFAADLGDIAQSSQKNSIEALWGMGLVKGDDNGNFNPDSEITRIEFLAMVIRMIGLEDGAKATAAEELVFTDIPADHWGRGYAYWAYNLGIANGISETEFGTNQKVTYNQAAKMIVAALGYRIVAEIMGGYPQGYLVKAAQLDILDGISGGERALKREEVARLIFNALTVPMFEEQNGEYTESDDPLTKLGCKKYEGTVTGTYDTQTNTNLDKNMVEISGKRYKTTYFVGGELHGAKVVFYTKNENGDEVVCLVYERYTSEKLTVDAENILEDTTLSLFKYKKDGKTRQESLPGGALKVIYNGKSVSTAYMSDEILKPAGGSVVLRDSDSDGRFDIAVVTAFTTMVANAVSEKNVYDKYGNNLDIDIEEEQLLVYIDGKEAPLTDIKNGDVLTVAKSIDGEKIVIYVNRDSFEGKVLTRDDEEKKWGIEKDGKVTEYSVAKEYSDAIKLNKSEAKDFKLGDSGAFHTNHIGQIAYCTLTKSKDERYYGYVLEAATKSAIGSAAQFRILTTDNKFTVFETEKNKKIRFARMEGSSYKVTMEDAEAIVTYLTGGYEFSQQICSYKTDENGFITEFQLANTSGNDDRYLRRGLAPQAMNYTTNLLNQTYIVDENTAVFYIPNSGQYEDIMAAGKYNKFLATGRVNVALYDIEDSHVGALVYLPLSIERYDNGKGEYETIIDNVNSPVLYIQKTTYVTEEDGDTYLTLTGIEDGEIIDVKVADDLSGISDDRSLLKSGVAIQYEKNDLTRGRAETSDEEEAIIVFKVVHDFTSSSNTLDTQTFNYSYSYQSKPKISVMYTTLSAVAPSFITTNIQEKVAPIGGGTVFMRYNPQIKEKFEKISSLDLSVGQKVVIRSRYLNTREIVVVED